MLPCNNVIDLKWRYVKCSRQVTIFTTITGSLPNLAREIGVQYDWLARRALQSCSSLGLQNSEEIRDVNIAVEFDLFLTCQLSLTSQL